MKICITSRGDTLDSEVDPRFGRCAHFIFIDPQTMEFTSSKNDSIDAAHGAGIGAGKTVINAGAAAVLTGDCGPKATQTLQTGGIAIHTGITGTVRQAVEAFKANQLAG